MPHYILGRILVLLLNVIHFSFYFDFRERKWPRLLLSAPLLVAPLLRSGPREDDVTGFAWPIQVLLYAVLVALIFHVVLFKGGLKRIFYGVFLIGTFSGMGILAIQALYLHVLAIPLASASFWDIRLSHLALYIAMYPLLYRYVRRPFRAIVQQLGKLSWDTATLAPMLIFMITNLMVPCSYIYPNALTLALSGVVSANTITFFHYSYKTIVREDKYRILRETIESSNKFLRYIEMYNRELDRKERTIRTIRHDLRHVLGGLTLAARDGDTSSLLDVAKSVADLDIRMPCPYYTDNPAINAVVSFYFSIAGGQGVSCTARLALPDPPGIPGPELVMLLGNALDNCVKGASPLGEKGYIDIRVKQVKDCLVFKTVNNFAADQYSRGEGLGLESMRTLCEKREGRLDVETAGNEFRLTMVVKLDSPPNTEGIGNQRATENQPPSGDRS